MEKEELEKVFEIIDNMPNSSVYSIKLINPEELKKQLTMFSKFYEETDPMTAGA